MNNALEVVLKGMMGLIWLFALTLTAVLLGPIHLFVVLPQQLLRKLAFYSSVA